MKNLQQKFGFIALTYICLPFAPAWAASAYIVDDAGIVDPGQIQSESWFSHTNQGDNTAVINLHYQLVPDTEWVLQETYDHQGDATANTISPQIKYQWLKADDNSPVTSCIIFGTDYIATSRRVPDFNAYIPVTVNATDKLDVNINAGWEYVQQVQENWLTWGAGTEYHFTPAVSVVDNIFGHNWGNAGFQIGPRAVVSDNLQLDFIYGHNVAGQGEDVLTAGITITL